MATTHLLFNPKAGEVKLAQISCLLAELHRLATASGRNLHPCILCGDFNSIPNCPLLQLIEQSQLDYSFLSGWEIAGYFQDRKKSRSIPIPLLPPHLNIGLDCTYTEEQLSSEVDMEVCSPDTSSSTQGVHPQSGRQNLTVSSSNSGIRNVISKDSQMEAPSSQLTGSRTDNPAPLKSKLPPGTITHPFAFTSAYPSGSHHHHSSAVTTYHQSAFETVDYIFFTPLSRLQGSRRKSRGFHLVSRKALPSTHTLLELGPQPHQFLSSDHLLLQANFQLFH